MLAELTAALKDVKFGEKESYTGQLFTNKSSIFSPIPAL